MRRLPLALAACAALGFPAAAAAHELFDHMPPGRAPTAPANPAFQAGGDGATWSLLGTVPTGNPHSDLDFFTSKGESYAAVGTLGTGPNSGGITIVKLTDKGAVTAPSYVSGHGSATCFSNPSQVLNLQHDIEATPKGGTITNTFLPNGAPQQEAQVLIDATDGVGRCHDQGTLGLQNAPQGGLEIVDITNPATPVEIGLTTHVGQAHTVNVDPRRPHIAYAVTSDGVGVDADGKRANETSGNGLDGWEVVDLRSCMYFPATASIADKRESCKPQVYRYRYESVSIALGHTLRNQVFGCHELEVYPEDKLTCGGGAAAILFDIAGMFNDNGTPDDFTDDKVNGTPLPCERRASSSAGEFNTPAKVVDCGAAKFQVSQWLKDGAPSVAGVKHLGSAFHMGRTSTQGSAQPPFDSTQDIDFDHEAELTTSRKFILATDERGGGVAPPGATCPASPGTPGDNKTGNGGLHAYAVDRLQKATPAPGANAANEAFKAYALDSKGQKAIFRARVRTQPEGSLCTAHVFQQIPGQNRIFMGWYSQGTQVIDFTENPDGTLDFKEAGYFIPANANQWVSHIFKAERMPDGKFRYFGATGDFNIGAAGRSAIDVFSVTLPPPPTPAGGTGRTGEPAPAPAGTAATAGAGKQCRETAGFRSVSASGRGRGLRIGFERFVRGAVSVDVFRQSQGNRVTGERLVARFRNRSSSFTWNGRGAGDGTYVVRFRVPVGGGKTDVRRVAVERRGGRWFSRPDFYRRSSCDLLQSVKLERPVFGGRNTNALLASFTLRRAASVTVVVRDARGRVVRRFAPRTYASGRTHRLRVRASLIRKGLTRVEIVARGAQTQSSATLAARRL